MRTSCKWVAMVVALMLAVPGVALGAKAKKYQVTGVVVALTADVITVEKGKAPDTEKWEIARDAATKVEGELKVGSKVTIEYVMTASDVEVKDKPAK